MKYDNNRTEIQSSKHVLGLAERDGVSVAQLACSLVELRPTSETPG